jgi:hypothetical protein
VSRSGRTHGRAIGVLLALVVSALAAASPAQGDIVINEVESQPTDWVELYNTGPGAVDISGWEINDDNPNNPFAVPGGTPVLQPGDFYAAVINPPVGLGNPDAVNVEDSLGNPIATFPYTAHAAQTWGRCADGTGAFSQTVSATMGAANDCQAASAAVWPGSTAVATLDTVGVFGPNLSGLAYQPSGTSARGVLWASRNSSTASLWRLVFNGTNWVPDMANGWSAGKQIFFPTGDGVPDAEGITLTDEPNVIYASIERNDVVLGGGPPEPEDIPRPGIVRFDVSGASATLTATREWNFAANIPAVTDSNGGLEAIAWIPDSELVAKGFIDEATGLAYNPATYANHGNGLFFVGVEQTGQILAYALDLTNGATFTRVATIATRFPSVMDLEYEPETKMLWAACDDTCNGRTIRLDIAQSGVNDGKFQITDTFERPAGAANLNNEGFAIAPQAECVNGLKPTFYADDSSTGGHAVLGGQIACTVLPPAPGPGTGGGGGQTPPPGGGGGTTPPPGGGGTNPPPITPDAAAPTVKLALKFAKKGTYAIRKTGKFGLTITLNEKADITASATARKNSKSKARTILKKTTRKGVAAGKRTITFTVPKSIRRKLKKGETVTLTLQAVDAAGNKSKSVKVSAKIPA